VSTFVSVGNATQPFTRMLKAVCEVAIQLPQPVIVQFGSTSFDCPSCAGVAFLQMEEFERRVSEAKLLILHAGAGSVLHAIRAGKRPIVMPRRGSMGEHVDDHQLDFAHALERIGKVFVAHDSASLAQTATKALERQGSIVATEEPPLVTMVGHAILRGRP
jgi:UDP-N-acetylglucosamine transferase subunit ALG13